MKGEPRYIVHVRLQPADGEDVVIPLVMAKSHAAIFPRRIRIRREHADGEQAAREALAEGAEEAPPEAGACVAGQ